jgi:hypothetical protein
MRNSADGLCVNLRMKEHLFAVGKKCSASLEASHSASEAADRIACRNKFLTPLLAEWTCAFRQGDEMARL